MPRPRKTVGLEDFPDRDALSQVVSFLLALGIEAAQRDRGPEGTAADGTAS